MLASVALMARETESPSALVWLLGALIVGAGVAVWVQDATGPPVQATSLISSSAVLGATRSALTGLLSVRG